MNLILIDNYDSFTYNLKDYFLQLDCSCSVYRNDELSDLQTIDDIDGIIISPGPSKPENSGELLPFIKRHFKEVPMLGICLGHQALGTLFGAQLVELEKPMHGKVSEIHFKNDPLFEGIDTPFNAVRYHSLFLQNLPPELNEIAFDSLNQNMAFRHEELPLVGIQFHPESILTENGLLILKNWVNSLK